MSEATGLGPIETSVLAAYGAVGALTGEPMVKNQRISEVLFRDHRIAPLFGYRTICDFARPYVSHLELVEFNGNYGSPDFSEASARYTESRLSPLGEAALLAERSERSALPIGLINGTVHLDGPTPPFDPHRIVAGLLAAHDGASDAELIDPVGSPSFPTGCHVDVDIAELAAGRHTVVRCEAHFDRTEHGELVISRLPPRRAASDIASGVDRSRPPRRQRRPPDRRSQRCLIRLADTHRRSSDRQRRPRAGRPSTPRHVGCPHHHQRRTRSTAVNDAANVGRPARRHRPSRPAPADHRRRPITTHIVTVSAPPSPPDIGPSVTRDNPVLLTTIWGGHTVDDRLSDWSFTVLRATIRIDPRGIVLIAGVCLLAFGSACGSQVRKVRNAGPPMPI